MLLLKKYSLPFSYSTSHLIKLPDVFEFNNCNIRANSVLKPRIQYRLKFELWISIFQFRSSDFRAEYFFKFDTTENISINQLNIILYWLVLYIVQENLLLPSVFKIDIINFPIFKTYRYFNRYCQSFNLSCRVIRFKKYCYWEKYFKYFYVSSILEINRQVLYPSSFEQHLSWNKELITIIILFPWHIFNFKIF